MKTHRIERHLSSEVNFSSAHGFTSLLSLFTLPQPGEESVIKDLFVARFQGG